MEYFFVLFLLSGQVKAFLQFFGLNLPADLTVLAAILVVGLTAFQVVRKRTFTTYSTPFFGVGLLLLFYSWMIFSLYYSASEDYSLEKTFYFLLNIAAFSAPFFFKAFNIRLFFQLFVAGTLLLAIGLLPFQYFDLLKVPGQMESGGVFTAIGGLYLSLSEYLGIIIVLFLTKTGERIFSKNLDFLVVALVLFVMLLLGARGPVIFALLVYLLYYLHSIKVIRFTIRKKTFTWMSIALASFVLVVIVMTRFQVTETLLSRSVYRFSSLINSVLSGGSNDHSANVRILLMKEAIDGIFQNIGSFIFGYGIGSFGIITRGIDMRLYPHNMILEVWFELGLIGLVLFAAWIVFVLLKLRRLPASFVSYWLLLYIFLNLMKSSSLIDIRTEFAIFALFAVQNFLRQQKPLPDTA